MMREDCFSCRLSFEELFVFVGTFPPQKSRASLVINSLKASDVVGTNGSSYVYRVIY